MHPVRDATVLLDYLDDDADSIGGQSRGIEYLCAGQRHVYWHLSSGTVVDVGWNRAHGNYAIIRRRLRQHFLCRLGDVAVKPGDKVRRNDCIGIVSLPGELANYPSLYYEVRRYPYGPGEAIDPRRYTR